MVYKVGMIGVEGHTGFTLNALPQMKNAQLTAVALMNDNQRAKWRRSGSYSPFVKEYDTYHQMLDSETLDIVCVYTPNNQITECVIATAKYGAHIYSEKPLAITLDDLAAARKAIETSQVTMTMMLSMRQSGEYQKAHEVVQHGMIGEITQCAAQKSYKVGSRPEWQRKRESLGGIIPYIGCHALDLLRWTSGLEFIKGAAFHNNVGNPYLQEMENSASMVLLANNGATVSARLDYCRPQTAPTHGDDRIRLAGTDGVIEVMHGEVKVMTNRDKEITLPPAKPVMQFVNLIEAIEGREELLVPTEDAYRITEIVVKLRNAADKQEMVEL